MFPPQQSVAPFRKQRRGVVFRAHQAFFLDDFQFGGEVLEGKTQVFHAVGFQKHHQFQAVARDVLIVRRIVAGRERVFIAAVAGDDFGKLSVGDGGRSFEHQVFQNVRDARFAERIVNAARFVPNHVRYGGRAMVFYRNGFHAVV